MKKMALTLVTLLFVTSSWATGLIECKFHHSDLIYKLTVLTNPGSDGVSLEYKIDEPTFSHIDGRDGENVKLNPIGDTGKILLEVYSDYGRGLSLKGILTPEENSRYMGIELFYTLYGQTRREEARCFVIAH